MTCTRCQRQIAKGQKYYRTKRGPHHETCFVFRASECKIAERTETMPVNFQDYLAGCLNRAHPIIDHALRACFLEDGRVMFYIHPANADGDTPNFTVSGNVLLRWPDDINS
jgi:hypothetical protein